ncbi:MAG: nucleotidyltransferase family protein, partial [Lachnospiraceae bacterium]|nr:nucleotidyltransferase family protein [Lachnospiraceae bacterium]
MNTAGIVAEYNPFHNGHKYHIEETKRITGCDDIIVALSGNFVQRGEPAIVDKWTRTRCALLNGASMVIELPVLFSTAGAQYFSHGAVKLIND